MKRADKKVDANGGSFVLITHSSHSSMSVVDIRFSSKKRKIAHHAYRTFCGLGGSEELERGGGHSFRFHNQLSQKFCLFHSSYTTN